MLICVNISAVSFPFAHYIFAMPLLFARAETRAEEWRLWPCGCQPPFLGASDSYICLLVLLKKNSGLRRYYYVLSLSIRSFRYLPLLGCLLRCSKFS